MKEENTEPKETTKGKLALFSSVSSLGVHILFALLIFVVLQLSDKSGGPRNNNNSIVRGYSINASEFDGQEGMNKPVIHRKTNEKNIRTDKTPNSDVHRKAETSIKNRKTSDESLMARNSHAEYGYDNIDSAGGDSTELGQIYQESTLNVKMKYPRGWVFVDQQRKNRLDGITFWCPDANFNPPPYIHVEVVEKYLFNPELYMLKYNFGKFIGYYNEPVEFENQVSQVIYIRTNDDEDYTIKIIMSSKEAYREFQPVFFSIIKSFTFGKSFL
ncbi:MAG: hypothetical protein WCJ01_10180 [Ignavibacteria bacterium]